jgi:hypothetical protein
MSKNCGVSEIPYGHVPDFDEYRFNLFTSLRAALFQRSYSKRGLL